MELFVNGIYKGTRVLNPDNRKSQDVGKYSELERYRSIGRDIPYKAGELTAIGCALLKKIHISEKIQTAGDPTFAEKSSIV